MVSSTTPEAATDAVKGDATAPTPTTPLAAEEESAQDVAGAELEDGEVSAEPTVTPEGAPENIPKDAEDDASKESPSATNTSEPSGPPLPDEPAPQSEDDGWDCHWDANAQAWFFHNRLTGNSQWDNPRASAAAAAQGSAAQAPGPQPPTNEQPAAGGYNPAIHGDYDPNAWYAQGNNNEAEVGSSAAAFLGGADLSAAYAATATFNRFTGQFQASDMGPERHSDEAKSRRQMNAFFDVDSAANAHDGRSLRAERSHQKPSKSELKAFKDKRRARKEEKRRAWLRD